MHRTTLLGQDFRETTTMKILVLISVLACMCGVGCAQGRPRIIVIRRTSPPSSSSNIVGAQSQTSAPPAPTTNAASPAAKVTSGSYDGHSGSANSHGYDSQSIYNNLMLAEHLDVPYSRDPTRHYLSNKLDIPYVLLANRDRGSSGGYDHVNYLISQKLDVPYLPTLSNNKRGYDPLRAALIMDSYDSPIIYRL